MYILNVYIYIYRYFSIIGHLSYFFFSEINSTAVDISVQTIVFFLLIHSASILRRRIRGLKSLSCFLRPWGFGGAM